MDPTGTNQLHDAFQKKCRYIRTRIALASIAYSSCMVRRRFASEKWEWRVGLRTCMRPLLENCLLAWMECAAPSFYLMTRPWLGCDGYRFRERRDRPLCHLMVRQQTWLDLKNSVQSAVAAGLRMWEIGRASCNE